MVVAPSLVYPQNVYEDILYFVIVLQATEKHLIWFCFVLVQIETSIN